MPFYSYLVTVECETESQALMVMAYRLDHDEEIEPDDGGPFDYTIEYGSLYG